MVLKKEKKFIVEGKHLVKEAQEMNHTENIQIVEKILVSY